MFRRVGVLRLLITRNAPYVYSSQSCFVHPFLGVRPPGFAISTKASRPFDRRRLLCYGCKTLLVCAVNGLAV